MTALPPVESTLVGAIYAAYVNKRPQEDRTYLGISTFGTDCDRALWYGWRKAGARERLDGRKIRLFETGHREEARLIEDLRAAGVDVVEIDPDSGKQWSVHALGGHMRGHLDGIATGVPESAKKAHVVECKTHNEKSFKALVKDGVEKSKPGHYRQMMLYMHLRRLDRSLYIAQNKNDEAIYAERVRYDPVAALQMMARAERIVAAERPPSKLHEDPNKKEAFACGWCASRTICHEGAFASVNCRTCLSSTPIVDESNDARWRCEHLDRDLSLDEQAGGCAQHLFIPDLVPGEQIDFSDLERWVEYRLTDGTIWRDTIGKTEAAP